MNKLVFLLFTLFYFILSNTMTAQTFHLMNSINRDNIHKVEVRSRFNTNDKGIASLKKVAIPIILIGYGGYCRRGNGFPSSYKIQELRQKSFQNFQTSIDDYLAFYPLANSLILNSFNIKGKHDFIPQMKHYFFSYGLTLFSTYAIKYITHVERPDGSSFDSFPSGHTAFAFAGAEVLHQEYGKHSVWISIGGYSAATAVATLRVLNNRHWYSDVLVGAGLGMLCTKFTYWAYPKIFKDKKKVK